MHLSIDGVRLVNESHLWVPLDKSVAITCVALESRPKVDLSWVINDYDNITMETNITTDDNVTYTSTSTLYHVPSRQVETISCIAHGVASTSYRKNVTLFSHGKVTIAFFFFWGGVTMKLHTRSVSLLLRL